MTSPLKAKHPTKEEPKTVQKAKPILPRSTSPAKGTFFGLPGTTSSARRAPELEARTAALNYYYGIEDKYHKPAFSENERSRAKAHGANRSVSCMSEQNGISSTMFKQGYSHSVQ